MKGRILASGALLLLSVLVVAPFFYSKSVSTPSGTIRQMIHTHDMVNHLKTMEQFDRSLRSGLIEPRWFSDINKGYGSATLNFYPRLFYYLTSAVNLVAGDWHTTLFIVCVLALAGSAAAFYWLARMFYNKLASAVAALAYMLLPYHLLNLYWRGAIPELIGFVLMPLILGFAIKVATKPAPSNFAGLGLLYGIHLMTHMPVGLLFSYAMVFFAVWWSLQRHDVRIALRIGAGMALGLIVGATYWLPATLEAKTIYEPASAIFPYHETYVSSVPAGNVFDMLITTTFKFNAVILLSALILFVLTRSVYEERRAGAGPTTATWLACCAAALFMCTGLSYDLSRLLPGIQAAVPPFRWMSVSSVFAGLLIAGWLDNLHLYRRKVFAILGLAFVIGLNLWLAGVGVIKNSLPNGPEQIPAGLSSSGFIPAGAAMPDMLHDTPRVQIDTLNGLSEIIHWDPEYRAVKVRVDRPSRVRLKTYNYAGWTLDLDGERTDFHYDATGVQAVWVSEGTHLIETTFRSTFPRILGRILTVFGLLVVGTMILSSRRVEAAPVTAGATAQPSVSRRLGEFIKSRQGIITLLLIAVGIGATWFVISGRSRNLAVVPDAGTPGDDGRSTQSSRTSDSDATLNLPGQQSVSVAVDEESLNKLMAALANRDSAELEKLNSSGKVLRVENQTRVKVLSRESGKIKLRISEGQYQFAEGWVLEAWVRQRN